MRALLKKPFFFSSVIFAVLLVGFILINSVFGWTNPSQNPPSGGGILYYINNKLGIGTSTPPYLVSISSSTDSLLGLFRQGGTIPTIFKQGTDNAFVINNNNADIVSIKNNNVGIGTTGPGNKLHVNNTSGTTAGLRVDTVTATGANGGALVLNAPSGSNHLMYEVGGVQKWIQYVSGNDLRFYDTTDRVTIQNGGNVGIGTTNPIGAKLVVNGTISASTPVNDTDVATKAYVDAAGGGGGFSYNINWITTYKHYFLTATTYNGNLGGLAGATTKCNADVNKISGKTYHAYSYQNETVWNKVGIGLYNSTYGESINFTIYGIGMYGSDSRYYSMCGNQQIIGTDVICGSIAGVNPGLPLSRLALNRTSSNGPAQYQNTSNKIFWMTNASGSGLSYTCSNWSTSADNNSGNIHYLDTGVSSDPHYIGQMTCDGCTAICNQSFPLLCIEN